LLKKFEYKKNLKIFSHGNFFRSAFSALDESVFNPSHAPLPCEADKGYKAAVADYRMAVLPGLWADAKSY